MFKRKKNPTELVKSALKHLQHAEQKQDGAKHKDTKAFDKVSQNLKAMRLMLYGDEERDAKEESAQKLASELLEQEENLLILIIKYIIEYDFEAQKDVERVFSYLLRHGHATVKYFLDHEELLNNLVAGYKNPDIALHCGPILRECLRHEELCEKLLHSDDFSNFFALVQDPNFDIAADAFETFKIMLTQHKTLCARFLEKGYEDIIIEKYNKLIQSDNYVTRRQSLKLLGEILLDRENFKIMMKYINDPSNLKIMMNLLRERSAIIQFEAFHVFKVFVANPKKSKAVLEILYRNRDKLIDFLQKFQQDKDDEQFVEEKNILLSTLKTLEAPADKN